MQQTTKYKLNLVEKTDVFSPDALNQNMEKVEAQFDAARAEAAAGDAAEAAARTAAVAALDERVTVLELHHFACGHYTGTGVTTGDTQFIELDFTPKAVLIPGIYSTYHITAIALTGKPLDGIEIKPGGFQVSYNPARNPNGTISDTANNSGTTYRYLAFA